MFTDPQFWIFIAFVIFIGSIYNPVKKTLSKTLNNKINDIKENIDKAEKLKNETQQTLSEIKKRQKEIQQEIIIIQKEAKDKISLLENNAYIKLKEQIKKRNELAKLKIDQMTRDANIVVQKYIIQKAITATINILEKKINDKEKQNLINQSITELEVVLKN